MEKIMRANPGGEVGPANTVGRDHLIEQIWQILDNQSVVLTAERRMGKTSVIKKMQAEASSDKLPVYRDLEGITSPIEFVETVFSDVEQYLSRSRKTATRTRQFLAQLDGAQFKGIKFPKIAQAQWKTLLSATIQDLVEHQDKQVILFWDEMPLMLDNIRKAVDPRTAMEVLDALRALRQMDPTVRMVYTGSIGLHHIVKGLREEGYSNSPKNDMYSVDVPPLTNDAGAELALRLLEGESVPVSDKNAVSRAISEQVDGIPFYIHHVVRDMKLRGERADVQAVRDIVQDFFLDPQDRLDLRHYRNRLNTYYPTKDLKYVINLLNILATSDQPLSYEELSKRLSSTMVVKAGKDIPGLLQMLRSDHYVELLPTGAYQFRFPFIQRWWRSEKRTA
jgi:hypothetical protein